MHEKINPKNECAKSNNLALFLLKIHHGGIFTKFPDGTYVEGQVKYVDLMDQDEFSVHEINAILKELDYEEYLNFGLRALDNDADVLNFLQYVDLHTLMEIYIEHCKKKLKLTSSHQQEE
ncbi:hypothetical protein R6Q57_022103 [Mikania cordata]